MTEPIEPVIVSTPSEPSEPDAEPATSVMPRPDTPLLAYVPQNRGVLTPTADQEWWSSDQLAALESRGIRFGTARGDFPRAVGLRLLHEVQRTGLDPFSGQIVPMKVWNEQDDGSLMAGFPFIVSIGSLQARASLTGEYEGMEGPQFLTPGTADDWIGHWPFPGHPEVARVKILRKSRATDWSMVEWAEICPKVPVFRSENGTMIPTGRFQPPPSWRDMPSTMLKKCAKAAGLRDVFPETCGGYYVPEEMEKLRRDTDRIDREGAASATRHNRAAELARLAEAGRGVQAAVKLSEVQGDTPGKLGDVAGEVVARIAAKSAELAQARADAAKPDEDPQDEQAWLWLEIQSGADLLSVSMDVFTARAVALNGPLERWSAKQMLAFIGPLRPVLAQKLQAAGRADEARAYREAGPDLIAPLEVLFGREDQDVARQAS